MNSLMESQVFSEKHGSPSSNGGRVAGISSQTYVSVGLFAMLLAGFWAILNTLYSAKSEISSRLDKVEWNQSQMRDQFNEFKAHKMPEETWDYMGMFKWCVKFQRDNPQIKVPEPEISHSP